METTLSIQSPTVSLIETLSEDLKALLSEAGFSTADLQRLLDPRTAISLQNWK